MGDIETTGGRAVFVPDPVIPELTPGLQRALYLFWLKWWDDTSTADLTSIEGAEGYTGILIPDAQDLDEMAERIQDLLDPEWFK